jgi:hypothetical protein
MGGVWRGLVGVNCGRVFFFRGFLGFKLCELIWDVIVINVDEIYEYV